MVIPVSILSKMLKKKKKRKPDNLRQQQDPEKPENLPIHRDYKQNISRVKEEFGTSSDIVIREIKVRKHSGATLYVDGLADSQMISDFILENSMEREVGAEPFDFFQYMIEQTVAIGSIKTITNWNQVYDSILSGDTVIFLDGFNKAISCETRVGKNVLLVNPRRN